MLLCFTDLNCTTIKRTLQLRGVTSWFQGLNTSAATNPSDSSEPDGADKDKLISYLDSLSDYGFTVEETGAGYQWNVTDANGNKMEFMCGDGYLGIEIQKAQ